MKEKRSGDGERFQIMITLYMVLCINYFCLHGLKEICLDLEGWTPFWNRLFCFGIQCFTFIASLCKPLGTCCTKVLLVNVIIRVTYSPQSLNLSKRFVGYETGEMEAVCP